MKHAKTEQENLIVNFPRAQFSKESRNLYDGPLFSSSSSLFADFILIYNNLQLLLRVVICAV